MNLPNPIKPIQNNYLPSDVVKDDATESILLAGVESIKIPFLDYNVDRMSTFVHIFGILLLTFVWIACKLFKNVKTTDYLIYFYIIPICYIIYQLLTSDPKAGNIAYETMKLTSVEETSGVLLGAVILFTVLSHIKIQQDLYPTIFAIMGLSTVTLVVTSLTITGQNIRVLRKLKQECLNISIFLFITVIFILSTNIKLEYRLS